MKHLSVHSSEIAKLVMGAKCENNNSAIKKREELAFQGEIIKNWINAANYDDDSENRLFDFNKSSSFQNSPKAHKTPK